MPCNYIHTEFGSINDTIAKGCETDREKQMNYLSNFELIVYTDEEMFQLHDFDASIEKRSRFYRKQIDNSKPTWFNGSYRMNDIEDESSYLQWGQTAVQ